MEKLFSVRYKLIIMEEKEIDRIERHENDNDEGATWSMSSNGGISRSSHDDGIIFQSKFIFQNCFKYAGN